MNEEEKRLMKLGAARQNQIKKQNEYIKKNYDRICVTVPKGTKERIQAQKISMNKLVNDLLLNWLDQQEKNN